MKLIFLSAMAWAQEHGAEHAEVSVPWNSIFVQTFNFIILFGLLFFLLRKTVKKHFSDRAQNYRELVDRAENARKEAEKNHTLIKERLAKLEASSVQNAERAKSEAEELRARLLEEAKALSLKIELEAARTATVELEKAKLELRRELLGKALSASEETFKKSLGSNDQKKLQNEFVEKIEVVGG